MTTREAFENIRNHRTDWFSLRTRLTILVTVEMLACIALAYGLDALLRNVINIEIEIPLVFVLLGISLLMGILVTSQLSKLFFNPIKKLRKAMDTVAAGDYTVRLENKSTSKEVLEIYSGFNLMTEELSATEILQTDFISNVSHEFKTPISAIEGYATLLQSTENIDETENGYVEKILFNTKRLSSLVDSILLLSKMENQQIPTKLTTYRIDEQIRQSIVALEPEWEKKNIEMDAELDSVEYLGNEQMMRHVWDNIIGNAIKFTPESGQIRIYMTKELGKIVTIVEDTGPGISEEAQKRIFDKFYQADRSHKQEGNGLGLALVKRILTIEKGEISVENLPDTGCRFTVTLKTK